MNYLGCAEVPYTCPRCDLELLSIADQLDKCEFCLQRNKTGFKTPVSPTEEYPAGRRTTV